MSRKLLVVVGLLAIQNGKCFRKNRLLHNVLAKQCQYVTVKSQHPHLQTSFVILTGQKFYFQFPFQVNVEIMEGWMGKCRNVPCSIR